MTAADSLSAILEGLPASTGRPPVNEWHPQREGHIDIRIDGQGRWFHEGGEIKREAMVTLFASILRREGDAYYLVTPVEKLQIRVDDAPLFVTQLRHGGTKHQQQLRLITHTGDIVSPGKDHPLWVEQPEQDPSPYVLVRDGLHGRLGRTVFYQLMETVEEGEDGALGYWNDGAFHPIGEKAP